MSSRYNDHRKGARAGNLFGADLSGTTFVYGAPESAISKVFIDGTCQFANSDFMSALHRFGDINGIRKRDYQQAIIGAFGNVTPFG